MNIRSIIILKKNIRFYHPHKSINIYCLDCYLVLIEDKFWWRSLNYMYHVKKTNTLSYERRKLRIKNFQRRTKCSIIYRKRVRGFFQDGRYIYIPFYKNDLLRLRWTSKLS